MQALKASLLEPLLALHDATSDFAFASAALTQFPVASFGPYLMRNTALPSALPSALQNADATLAAPSSPFEPDDFGACAFTRADSVSFAPYFALNASPPIFKYSALQAATAGESEGSLGLGFGSVFGALNAFRQLP